MFTKRLLSSILSKNINKIYKTQVRNAFHEPFKSGHKKYEEIREKEWESISEWDKLSGGFVAIKNEFQLLLEEMKYHFSMEGIHNQYEDKEVVKFWDFNQNNNHIISSVNNKKSQMNDIKRWRTACDSDHNEGYSTCDWSVSPSGRALFSGKLDTKLPEDGLIVRAGFAFVGCEKARKSFYRVDYFDWLGMTHLILRVRGDGRNYFIILNSSDDNCDLMWFDRYQYVLYTHGGPYWQYVKIPFSRFFLQSKSKAQDLQPIIPLDRITQIGFLLADRNTGPFSLEIDFVGAMMDDNHTELTIYETYYHKEHPRYSPGST